MKKFSLFAAALFAFAIAFTGCNSNSPKEVAQKWLTSFYHMDYETAKKYSTEDTKKLLATFQQFSMLSPDSVKQQLKKIKVDIKDVKETGDTAIVMYVITDSPKEQKLKLLKQDGKWLVAKTKQDDMGDDESNTPTEPSMADTTAPAAETMTVDSSVAPK